MDVAGWISVTNQSLPIQNVIRGDWKRLDQIVRKIKLNLGQQSSPTYTGLTITGLTASRLVWTDSAKALASKDLVDLVVGTAKRVTVTDDSAGGIVLSGPQDLDTVDSPTFAGGTFTGTVTGIDPVIGTDLATKDYVDEAIGVFIDFYFSDTLEGVIATYYDMYDQPTGEAESTITNASLGTGDDQLLATHITESGQPGIVELRSGVYDAHVHAAKTVGTKPVTLYWTLSTRTTGGSETLRMTSEESGVIAGSNTEYEMHSTLASNITINNTDRLVWKLYANVAATGSAATVVFYMEGNNDSHVTISVPSSVWQRQGDVLDDLNVLGAVGADSELLVGTGAGAFAWESGATLRTSLGLGTGDAVQFSGVTTTYVDVSENVSIRSGNQLVLLNDANNRSINLQAPGALATSQTYTLPLLDGAAGEGIITDGNGILSFASVGATFVGLSDTPANYVGGAKEICVVNAAGNAIEFRNELLVYGVGQLFVNDVLYLNEQAAADGDIAGRGQIWVKNTAPNELWFTDDTGVDAQLGTSGAFTSRARVTLGTLQSIVTSTLTKMNLDTEQYDDSNEFASYKFTVTDAGRYLIVFNVYVQSIVDQKTLYGYIFKNGALAGCITNQMVSAATVATFSLTGSDILELATNDYIELYCWHNHGSNRDAVVPANLNYNFIAIHRIS